MSKNKNQYNSEDDEFENSSNSEDENDSDDEDSSDDKETWSNSEDDDSEDDEDEDSDDEDKSKIKLPGTVQEILDLSKEQLIELLIKEDVEINNNMSLGELRYLLLNEIYLNYSLKLFHYQFDWNEDNQPIHIYLFDKKLLIRVLEDCYDEDSMLFEYAVLEQKENPGVFYAKTLFKMFFRSHVNLIAAQKLVVKGADINYMDGSSGYVSLLEIECEENPLNYENIEFLLKNKIDVNKDEEKALRNIVRQYNNKKIKHEEFKKYMNLLISYGAKIDTAIKFYEKNENYDVEILILNKYKNEIVPLSDDKVVEKN